MKQDRTPGRRYAAHGEREGRCARHALQAACRLALLLVSAVLAPRAFADSKLERAGSLWWSGDYSGAEAAYTELIASGGEGETTAMLELAALYRSTGDYESAAAEYRAALQNTGALGAEELDGVYVSLGECLYYSHALEEAETVFRAALERAPRSLGGLFGLGRVFYEKGNLLAADVHFTLAAIFHPDFPGSFVYLAKVAEGMGEREKAIDYNTKALKLDGHQVELRYSLAEEYQSLGRYEEAFAELHRLRNIDAENRFVSLRLEEVRPRLAKLEEELIPVKTLEKFSTFKQVANTGKVPKVRIGLNSDPRGRPLPIASLAFVSNGEFKVRSGSGEGGAGAGSGAASVGSSAGEGGASAAGSGTGGSNTVFRGKPSVPYLIEIRDGRMFLLEGAGTKAASAPDSSGTGTGGASVSSAPGWELSGQASLEPVAAAGGSFIVKRVEYARGFPWAGIADRQYRGRLEVSLSEGGLKIVNELNIEEYLYSVVPSEMPVSFPAEALKAQAVIARSYALSNARHIKPHQSEGYDLCDGQHCQVYSGVGGEYAKGMSAVDATRGVVLTYQGKVARPYFHSTCGGHTQSTGEIGWGEAPYLVGVVDGPDPGSFPSSPRGLERWVKSRPEAYCSGGPSSTSPEYRWFRIVPAVFVEEKAGRSAGIGALRGVAVKSRNGSGYVHGLEVRGEEGSVTLERDGEIKRALGIGPLRSSLFWVDTKFDADGRPEEFVIYGGGWGHGVGLCQVGSSGMAKGGASFRKILGHYYQKAVVTSLGY